MGNWGLLKLNNNMVGMMEILGMNSSPLPHPKSTDASIRPDAKVVCITAAKDRTAKE